MTITDQDRIMQPIININGTAREVHINFRRRALNALVELMEAVSEIRPHGRDYLGNAEAYNRDLDIHKERFAVLDKLRNEIMDEALAIQGDN